MLAVEQKFFTKSILMKKYLYSPLNLELEDFDERSNCIQKKNIERLPRAHT